MRSSSVLEARGLARAALLEGCATVCCLRCAHVLPLALHTQLAVLQVEDESTGPCAFQMLQYVKLQVDAQVRQHEDSATRCLRHCAQLLRRPPQRLQQPVCWPPCHAMHPHRSSSCQRQQTQRSWRQRGCLQRLQQAQ
jgi:hypothetical protein